MRLACRVLGIGFFLSAAMGGSISRAQAINSGDIRGTVTDATGAILAGATVSVVNVNTGVAKSFTTDGAGLFDTSSIVAGSYRITFTSDGFKQLVRGPVTVLVGYTTVNASLQVGATEQQIVVTTDVPLLKTEDGTQETTLTARSMEQLPNIGQDWENFTILLPGASGNSTVNTGNNPGQGVSVNGNLPYNSILADGASSTLVQSTNADVSVFETVEEVQISTSAFSAQYGVGGIIMNQISKGGTSSFHGSLYEYFQNDALNAKGYQFGGSFAVPHLRYNNYGGSLGGPLFKSFLLLRLRPDREQRLQQRLLHRTNYRYVGRRLHRSADNLRPDDPGHYPDQQRSRREPEVFRRRVRTGE